ncbi:MAG: methyl-accepting chemotaxis protein, partial [Spirochaetia bacterium]|nr:methyl-accepting chemotaxis protein [Spirochaetota bacterium]MDW8113220.1 methyl-accepting chemotaxis protein [Spirochaetia bacterium]
MRKFRFGFAFRSTLLVSVIFFSVIFGASLFVMEMFYMTFRTYTENMLKVINKGFKQDYFDWAVRTIKDYGDTIIKNNFDEYNFFKDSIESSMTITAIGEVHSTGTDKYDTGKIFIVSLFYWDGEKLFSEERQLQNSDFINLVEENMKNMKAGDNKILISDMFPFPTYVYKLKQGVIGCVLHPELYNTFWLKNVFRNTKVNFYALLARKDENERDEVSIGNFKKVISEMETTQIEFETVYRTLSQKVDKGEELDVVSGTYADRIKFHIYQDYGDFFFKAIIGIPMRGVLYLTTFEVSLLISIPIVIILIIIMSILNRSVFTRIRDLSERMSELGKSGGDLSYRIEAKTGISEVREVAENINNFLDAVEEIVKKSKSTFRDVEQNIQVLSELGEEVVRVSEVISKQDEVRQMIEEINAMSGEVGTTVEEMLRTVETIRNNVERQYSMIEEMSGMVEETIMTVSNVGKRIERANELLSNLRDEALRSSASVRKNVEEVRDVNMFLGNVLEVVDVIKGISDRIEVLSMNAGIEAAHAGEAGRGFA